MTSVFRFLVFVAAALVVVAVGYFSYSGYRKSASGREGLELAQGTARVLKEALSVDPARPSTETAKAIADHAAAASRNFDESRRLTAKPELMDALDDFLLTGREILTRQAAVHQSRVQMLASTQALRQHMRADNRTGAWVREAVQRKERVEKDYRSFHVAADTFDKLLGAFPASVSRLAKSSGTAPLVDENLMAEARNRSNAVVKQAAGEMEKIRQIALPR
jgi:hypothetical protein